MQHEPQTIEQKQAEQNTGNRLKFKLEMMMTMLTLLIVAMKQVVFTTN